MVGYKTGNDYESLVAVLSDLTDVEKQNLVNKVQELVGSSSVEALTRFIAAQAQRSALIDLLRSAVSELNNKGG